MPLVKEKKPKQTENYRQTQNQGISLYIHHELKYASKTLGIGMKKILWLANIYAFDPETICLCGGYYKEEG